MQTENRLFDDFARLATGAVGTLTGMRQEIEVRVKEQLDRLLSRMDLVTREEFDAVQEMAARARLEQELMGQRLAALEAKLGAEPSTAAENTPPVVETYTGVASAMETSAMVEGVSGIV